MARVAATVRRVVKAAVAVDAAALVVDALRVATEPAVTELTLTGDREREKRLSRLNGSVGQCLWGVGSCADQHAELAKQVQQALFESWRVGHHTHARPGQRAVAKEVALQEGQLKRLIECEQDIGQPLLMGAATQTPGAQEASGRDAVEVRIIPATRASAAGNDRMPC